MSWTPEEYKEYDAKGRLVEHLVRSVAGGPIEILYRAKQADAACEGAGVLGKGSTPEAMATGGVKFDGDKPRMDLLDSYAIEQLSAVLTFGAKKYAAHNWRKGITKTRLIAAALRHIFAYLGGEDKDPETGLSHIAHAMCCCMFLLGLEHKPELDDRYKETQ